MRDINTRWPYVMVVLEYVTIMLITCGMCLAVLLDNLINRFERGMVKFNLHITYKYYDLKQHDEIKLYSRSRKRI